MRVRKFERISYLACLDEMQAFTRARDSGTEDEIWLVEHEPVFTLGIASKPEHLLRIGDIPCIQTERGGQVTYHGPGQLVAYVLLDLRRQGLMVRELVCRLESALIELLAAYEIPSVRKKGAPGIYVELDKWSEVPADSASKRPCDSKGLQTGLLKIASLGIRVSRGCAYHGLALNVAMDLEPFSRINPCGLVGQEMTDLQTVMDSVKSKRSQNCKKPESCKRSLNIESDFASAHFLGNSDPLMLEVSEALGAILKAKLMGSRESLGAA
jgi:lipoyl(octanoyl) transferase